MTFRPWRQPLGGGLLAGIVLLTMFAAHWGFGQPSPPKHATAPVRVIVLDPGHGGPDEGARGPTGTLEKGITLQVAQEAARLIAQHLGLRAVLTRSDDSAVSLETRAALANQAGGDLLISIHAGGSFAPGPRGYQTFYLEAPRGVSLAVREEVRAEGQPSRRGQAPPGTGQQPRAVLWEQAQLDFLEASQAFARLLQKNLRMQIADEGWEARGLPLLLLRWVRMPAVLLDLGSLSDRAFEDKLREEVYLQRAALGIAQAVNDYQDLRR